MWRRGADLDGNVANFVESEQILESQGYFASYTQVLYLACTRNLSFAVVDI
jgi:hypothetical protein